MTTLMRAEAISLELKTRLETRTIAAGAETNLGAVVYLGAMKVDPEMVPCCVIVEGDDTPSREGVRTKVKLAQRYALLAFVPCDPLHPNVAAHAAIRDLKRAVFTSNGAEDWTLGRAVLSVDYIGREIAPRADGLNFVLAGIEIEVNYAENLANP